MGGWGGAEVVGYERSKERTWNFKLNNDSIDIDLSKLTST